MYSLQVLIIDDEPAIRQILSNAVSNAGHSVTVAANGEEALERLGKGDIDVALCDIRMPDLTGIEVVEKARSQGIDTIFLLMTAFASVDTAIKAIRAGAYDYMLKPLRNEDFLNRLERLADVIHLKSENKVLRKLVQIQNDDICPMVSAAMQQVERLVLKVAPTDSTVLITGPSGSGKGVIAQSIHQNSQRNNPSFIPVNCGAIPENLIESEFFGHTKGAFTGAQYRRKGKIELAHGGTLFLDEIGDIPTKMQVDLLRVLETRRFHRLGGNQVITSDFRLVCATNRDLEALIEEGSFREDLYYRINVFVIDLPPLRDRPDDIPALTRHFIEKYAHAMGKPVKDVSPEVEALLVSYAWPGNVRELENAVERSMVIGREDSVQPEDLPLPLARSEAEPEGSTLAAIERRHIERVLRAEKGNITRAAVALGIDRGTLYNKLRRYDIERL